MATIDEEPAFVCSPSVQSMRDELGGELVTAVDLAGYLLGKHPDYAQGLAETMILARVAGAEMRSVDDWLGAVSAFYEDKKRMLDGRLVILGLALMIHELYQALQREDFLLILMAEYEPEYDSLLSSAGEELFYQRFGSLSQISTSGGAFLDDGGGGQSSPGAPDGSFSEGSINLDEVFESIGDLQMAEAAADDGAKGIDPDSLLTQTGAEEDELRQARRLEAAMPQSVQVQQTTELLVMLPRASSEGLRAFLPKETEAGEIIEKDDVEERGAELVFEAPDEPLTVYFAVEAAQKDFEIEEAVKRVKIHADRDGDYEVFYLTPLRATERAPVQVRLYKDEALSDAVSTIRLFAKIEPPELGDGVDPQLATLWRAAAYAAVPLNLNVSGDYISVGAISGSEGVAIGGGASAVVSRTNVVMAAGTITRLFTPLLRVVFGSAPLDQVEPAIDNIQALQVEVEKGPEASDPQIATLLQSIVEMVPAAGKALLELFGHPEVEMAAGDVTQFVLGWIEQK